MKQRQVYNRSVKLREKDGRIIEGYAILFNTPSAVLWTDTDAEAREVIAPEAVTKELLDGCDIKMTMYHNREKLLARSVEGQGSLSYEVDAKGVRFEFEAPATALGDEALELVRRGDIAGCSFAFSANYYDRKDVERSSETVDGVEHITYTVRNIVAIYDFTLAADPAYPSTSVSAREDYEPAPEMEQRANIRDINRVRKISKIEL